MDGFTLTGRLPFGFLGFALSGVGDINGDGFADFAIGQPGLDDGGSVIVVWGGGHDGEHPTLDGIAEGNGGVLHTGAEGLDLGSGIAPMGRQDGDRFPTMIIGAPEYSGPGREASGAAVTLTGPSPTPVSLNVGTPGSSAVLGSQSNERFGGVLSAVGDVDGDGIADLLVGSAEKRNPGGIKTGGAWLVRGQIGGGANVDLASKPSRSGETLFLGGAANDLAGWSATGTGDFNGDGVPDYAIGAIGAGGGQVAHVWGGNQPSSSLTFDQLAAGSRGVVYTTSRESDSLGSALAGVGDMNGDGFADLVIGATSASPMGRESAGIVYIIWGTNTPMGGDIDELVATGRATAIHGAAAGDSTGYTLAPAGDTNGDGLMDLLIGAPGAERNGMERAGAVWHFESPGEFPSMIDLAEGHPGLRQYTGTEAFGQLGLSLSAIGDWDGNGADDFAFGTPLAGEDLSGRGTVYTILSGEPTPSARFSGLLRRSTAINVTPGSTGNQTTTGASGLRLSLPSQTALSNYTLWLHRAQPDFPAANGDTHEATDQWWELESNRTIWTAASVTIPLAPLGLASDVHVVELFHAATPDARPTRPPVLQRGNGSITARLPGPGLLWIARPLPPEAESFNIVLGEEYTPRPDPGYTWRRGVLASWASSGFVTGVEISPNPDFANPTTEPWDSFAFGSEGVISWSLPSSDGIHQLFMRLTGTTGTSQILPGQIVLDTRAPSFQGISPLMYSNTIPPRVTGRLSEANPRKLTFQLAGESGETTLETISEGLWSWEIPPSATNIFAEGRYPAALTATDRAGWTAIFEFELLVDTTPPTSAITQGPTSQLGAVVFITASTAPDSGSPISPSSTNRMELHLRLAGKPWTQTHTSQSTQFLVTPPLGSGRYWAKTAAGDWAGNREAAPTGFNPQGSWSFAYTAADNDEIHVLQFPGETFTYPLERATETTGGSTRVFHIAHLKIDGTACDGETSLTMKRHPSPAAAPPDQLDPEDLVSEWIAVSESESDGPYTIEWKMPASSIPLGVVVDRLYIETPDGVVAHEVLFTPVEADRAVTLTATGVEELGRMFAGPASALEIPPGGWMAY